MNRVAKVLSQISDDMLMHYGVARRSGRYPWGSGDNPYQHSGDFLSRVQSLKKSGMSETDIAKTMGLTTTQLRTQMSLAKDERRAVQVATAKDLREKGYSLNEIADKMGFANDSSVRSLLNENSEARMNQAKATADVLRKLIDEKGMIDVGTGVERELGVSKEKLNQALYILEMEGYPIYGGGVPQVTNPGKQTNIKVICPPGTEHKDIYNYEDVHSVKDYISYDGGESFRKGFEYPSSMDSNRLAIRYKEDGGINKDGVIELRRGVQDLSLGDSHYAQVRIMVDGKKYLKGMAVYSDDMPDGVDVIFNTNKSKSVPKMEVLKDIKNDPDNPFGSLIKEHGGQSYYDDPKGKYIDPVTGKKQSLSLINKRAEEGDWGEWSKTLPSQFLSKQSLSLIKKQLGLATADKQSEFDEICSLTNPTVKKTLLKSFADDCDSAAVHLQAAALPRQKYQVILPLTTIKDNEVYAPNYKDGETVALIRYPHGGTFEIPILKVNNKLVEGKNLGSSVTAAQKAAIQNGTFDDLFIGDYWVISGVTWVIADMDYFLRCGDTDFTKHHLVIVPASSLYNGQMNATNTTEGGYVGSVMYKTGLDNAKAKFKAAFGDMLLTHRTYLVNAVANGKPSGGAWFDETVALMQEVMVYGTHYFEPANDGTTIPTKYSVCNSQLALMRLNPRMIKIRETYWLQNVVSSAYFAVVGNFGTTTCNNASNSLGVRPYGIIG